ncbi:cilia- and flagella-associated protein 157-like [Scophthalmus maximus]|uniref:cilia- and flagella-associated protein 157-like n=1 Tax=Scophthalmus maximus TaxID=52904 RepID=UPI001FA90FAA|nr:cilia- and flagella-associated protein 157-like [Scophthalmus maximus]
MADEEGFKRDKYFYLRKFTDLEEQLERCQLRHVEMEKQNRELTARYGALEKDKKKITEELKSRGAAKRKEADELVEQLQLQPQDAEQDKVALKLQHQQTLQELRAEHGHHSEILSSQAMKLEEQKENLMMPFSDADSLKEKLVSEQEAHDAVVRNMVIESLLESVMDSSLDLALEKEEKNQLQLLLSNNRILENERDVVRDRVTGHCFRRDVLRKHLSKITTEYYRCQKEVEQMRRRHHQLSMALKDQSSIHQHKQVKIQALRSRLASVSAAARHESANKMDLLATELQRERSRIRELEDVGREAAVALRHILTESEHKTSDMQKLLELMESVVPEGTDAAFMGPEAASAKKSSSDDPTPPAPQRVVSMDKSTQL